MIPDIYELIFCPPTQNEEQQVCETTPFVDTCVSLSHLFVCGNSALNWIVYLLAGEKFRSAWCNTYLSKHCLPSRLQRTNARYPRFQSPTKSPTTNGNVNKNIILKTNEMYISAIIVIIADSGPALASPYDTYLKRLPFIKLYFLEMVF